MSNNSIFAPHLFKDKIALITGGGTGIGFAIAKLLGSLGAHVIITSRTEDTLKEAVETLKKDNIHADYLPVNIREEQEVNQLFDTINSKWGGCDFLVNNAGGQFVSPALDLSPNG